MTREQREELAKLLPVRYLNRTFGNERICVVNHYDTHIFSIINPVKIRNINAKLAIKLWKLL